MHILKIPIIAFLSLTSLALAFLLFVAVTMVGSQPREFCLNNIQFLIIDNKAYGLMSAKHKDFKSCRDNVSEAELQEIRKQLTGD